GPSAPPGAGGPVAGPAHLQPQVVEASYDGYCSVDYLLYHIRNGPIPAATSTVPVGLISVNTSDTFINAVGQTIPGRGVPRVGFSPVSIVSTSTFGAKSSDYGDNCGFRITAGCWFDPNQMCGLEGSFFATERGSDHFASVAAVSGNQFLVNTGFTRNIFL